jgi:cobalt-zinc-cadmium efflux system outer membrane protein
MKIKILAVLAVLVLVHAPADAENKNQIQDTESDIDLSVVLNVVMADNPALKAARAQWQSVEESIPQAAAWDDPKIDISQTVKRFPRVPPDSFTDNGVGLEQSIPISGKNLSRERGARAQALAAYEEFRRTQLNITLRTKKAFYRYEGARAELEINKRSDDLLRQFSQTSGAKYEVGTRSQADVLMAETELAKNSEAGIEIQREISDAQSELNILMNRPPEDALGNPHSSPPPMHEWSFVEMSRLALARNPELQMARAKIEEGKALVQYAKRQWIPDPAIRVNVGRYNDASQDVSEISAGVSFNIPWVNAGKYSAEVRQMQANLERAQESLDAQTAETLAAVRDQIQKIETFHHHYMLYRDKIVPLSEQTVKSVQSAYESDKSSFLELTDAQHSLNELGYEEVTHLRDYKIAVAELDAITGDTPPPVSSPKKNTRP